MSVLTLMSLYDWVLKTMLFTFWCWNRSTSSRDGHPLWLLVQGPHVSGFQRSSCVMMTWELEGRTAGHSQGQLRLSRQTGLMHDFSAAWWEVCGPGIREEYSPAWRCLSFVISSLGCTETIALATVTEWAGTANLQLSALSHNESNRKKQGAGN